MTSLSEAVKTLNKHSQACLEALRQEDWPKALKHMEARQPLLDQLEAESPVPDNIRSLPEWQQWTEAETAIQQQMLSLNDKQVQLEQVFAQIQNARQYLEAYRLKQQQPAGTGSVYNLEG